MRLENLLDCLNPEQKIKIADFWYNWEWSGESYYFYEFEPLLNKEVHNVFIQQQKDTLYIYIILED